jgi:hypothetical protein
MSTRSNARQLREGAQERNDWRREATKLIARRLPEGALGIHDRAKHILPTTPITCCVVLKIVLTFRLQF